MEHYDCVYLKWQKKPKYKLKNSMKDDMVINRKQLSPRLADEYIEWLHLKVTNLFRCQYDYNIPVK